MGLRIVAFIVLIMGVSVLLSFLVWPGYELVVTLDDLDELEINSKVVLIGNVKEVRDFDGFMVMNVNGIDVVCNCGDVDYLEKDVEIKGLVDLYEDEKQIEVLKIRILDS